MGSTRECIDSGNGWFDPDDGGSGSDSGRWVCEQYVNVPKTGALRIYEDDKVSS